MKSEREKVYLKNICKTIKKITIKNLAYFL